MTAKQARTARKNNAAFRQHPMAIRHRLTLREWKAKRRRLARLRKLQAVEVTP